MDYDKLVHRFTHHPPFGNQVTRYEEIRKAGLNFALLLRELCPKSDELDAAVDFIDLAVTKANAAIARHEKPEMQQ